jgi:hypothetical protein
MDTSSMPGPGRYEANNLSDEQLVAMVDRALSRNTPWAFRLAEDFAGNPDLIVQALRSVNQRLFITPKGDVGLHLRGG